MKKLKEWWEEHKNVNLLNVLRKNRAFDRFLQRWLEKKRRYFLSSPSKEAFHRRLMKFYRPFMPFYKNASPEKLQNWDILERRDFFLKNVRPRAIDIGMQDGFFVRELKKNGINTVGVDSVELLVQHARSKDPQGEYHNCFAEKMPFPDNAFQTATCSHVLEHVLDPPEILKEIQRILKPAGRIIVVVPYDLDIEPTHLRQYDKEALLTEVGRFFEIESYHEKIGAGHGCIARKM